MTRAAVCRGLSKAGATGSVMTIADPMSPTEPITSFRSSNTGAATAATPGRPSPLASSYQRRLTLPSASARRPALRDACLPGVARAAASACCCTSPDRKASAARPSAGSPGVCLRCAGHGLRRAIGISGARTRAGGFLLGRVRTCVRVAVRTLFPLRRPRPDHDRSFGTRAVGAQSSYHCRSETPGSRHPAIRRLFVCLRTQRKRSGWAIGSGKYSRPANFSPASRWRF